MAPPAHSLSRVIFARFDPVGPIPETAHLQGLSQNIRGRKWDALAHPILLRCQNFRRCLWSEQAGFAW